MNKLIFNINNKNQALWISKLIDVNMYWQLVFLKDVEYQSDVIEIIDTMYKLNDIKSKLISISSKGYGELILDKTESLILLQCFADEYNMPSNEDGVRIGEHIDGVLYEPSNEELEYLKGLYNAIINMYGHSDPYNSNCFYNKSIKWYLGFVD